jgi:moderate conductance mechanosensitive channel
MSWSKYLARISWRAPSDLAKVKKVIKEVSKELMADPELTANLIEPLKMQGRQAVRRFRRRDPDEY